REEHVRSAGRLGDRRGPGALEHEVLRGHERDCCGARVDFVAHRSPMAGCPRPRSSTIAPSGPSSFIVASWEAETCDACGCRLIAPNRYAHKIATKPRAAAVGIHSTA